MPWKGRTHFFSNFDKNMFVVAKFQDYKASWNIITLETSLQTKFNIQC